MIFQDSERSRDGSDGRKAVVAKEGARESARVHA